MMQSVAVIVNKIKTKGWSWFFKRLMREFWIPETPVGKVFKPFNKFIYTLTLPLLGFIQVFNKKPFSRDILYLFYDLEVSPITYDFCWALVLAERKRKKLNLKSLHVVFVPGTQKGVREEMPDYEEIIDRESRLFRKHHVLFALTRLLPSCSGFTNCSDREEAAHLQKYLAITWYPNDYRTRFPTLYDLKSGTKESSSEIMSLQATHQALRYVKQWLKNTAKNRKTITISLRQYDYQAARNSNIEDWAKFAQFLSEMDYHVVIVSDTENAMEPFNAVLSQFDHFPAACWNVDLRMALYESCLLNLGVSSGPFSICWFNKNCRYIMFKMLVEGIYNTSVLHLEKQGYKKDTSLNFALPYQKLIWETDSFEIIMKEFKKLEPPALMSNVQDEDALQAV